MMSSMVTSGGSAFMPPNVWAGLSMSLIYVLRTTAYATLPTRISPTDTAVFLYSAFQYSIPLSDSCLIRTDIWIKLTHGAWCRIHHCQELAISKQALVHETTLSSGYSNIIEVSICNVSTEVLQISRGMPVAVIALHQLLLPQVIEVAELNTFPVIGVRDSVVCWGTKVSKSTQTNFSLS